MARGDAARAALVESAERLFAERGIEGVSLRDVSKAAGQRNNSAAQYHFDDRQGLVAAVYENRMRHVNDRRHAYMAGLDKHDVRGLVEATVIPLLDVVAETDGWYARFLARTRWEPIVREVLQSLPTAASFEAVVRGLHKALVPLPRPIRRSRIDQMITLVLGTLAGWEGAPDRGAYRLDRATFSTELVETAVAMLTAPSPARLQGAQP